MANEIKRMQLIAGLITESEYRKSQMDEAEIINFDDLKKHQATIRKEQDYLLDITKKLGVDNKLVGDFNKSLNDLMAAIFEKNKVNEMDEAVSYYGDINNLDKPESPEKEEAMAYLETPEGMNAVNILKNLVNSESFDLNELGRAIKKCDFKKTNHFRVAAKKAGLDLEGLGTLDNSGNGDFAVRNRNYKDKGYAVVFFNDKFERVG